MSRGRTIRGGQYDTMNSKILPNNLPGVRFPRCTKLLMDSGQKQSKQIITFFGAHLVLKAMLL